MCNRFMFSMCDYLQRSQLQQQKQKQKRIVSFDVGIKNLAYCVFATDAEKWSIAGWTCANLLALDGPAEPTRLCTQLITAGKKGQKTEHACSKTAKWTPPVAQNNTNNPLTTEYYCETHAKMHSAKWILPKRQHQSSQLKKLKLAELVAECESIGIDAGAKKAELVERIAKYYESKCYLPAGAGVAKLSASETDLVSIGRAIRRQLDSDAALEGTTHVIIENQISTIASRMKTIQGMIAQYFIMRFGDAVHIEFVSSHNKLKGLSSKKTPAAGAGAGATEVDVDKAALEPEPTKNTDKSTYKANKTDGVAICRQFFDANPQGMSCWATEFERSKKRDDLADCFLQGVWYLSFHKIIYYAEDLKINIVFVS